MIHYDDVTLKEFIKRKGLKGTTVAAAANIHKATLYKFMRGEIDLTDKQVTKLATYLGVTERELHTGILHIEMDKPSKDWKK